MNKVISKPPTLLLLIPTIIFLTLSANSQNLPKVMENQCRNEAKEIALKSYESCISVKKTEQIDHLRKEYQAKLLEIKNEYDQKIKDLATTKKVNPPATLHQTEPTIKLKKAKSVSKNKKRPTKNEPLITETEPMPSTQTDTITARVEDELNAVTGEVEKLEVQDVDQTQQPSTDY